MQLVRSAAFSSGTGLQFVFTSCLCVGNNIVDSGYPRPFSQDDMERTVAETFVEGIGGATRWSVPIHENRERKDMMFMDS